jgi:RimJ/RimL family protein N-acetyltransferase
MTKNLNVRLAGPDDAEDIRHWRNDTVTRAMSRNIELVDLNSHATWFKRTLLRPDRLLFVGVAGERKLGMVRFDRQQDAHIWEVSIIMAPEYRAKGLGKELLTASISDFCLRNPISIIIAEVKRINVASLRVFEAAGFVIKETSDDQMVKLTFSP